MFEWRELLMYRTVSVDLIGWKGTGTYTLDSICNRQ